MSSDLPDIAKVIEHYGGVIRRGVGNQLAVKCPFHNDTHASAGIHIRDNLYNCLTCGVGGNSLQIIALREGVSVREAVVLAEGITGESVRQLSGEREFGSGLPRRKGHNGVSGAIGSIRRSREP